MFVEISGIGFTNVGAELMLHATTRFLRSRTPQLEPAVPPDLQMAGCHRPIAAAGAWMRYRLRWRGIPLDWTARIVPTRLLRTYGLVRASEIGPVLDASGYKYGGSWGVRPIRNSALRAEAMRRRGQPYVLLPQSFGPFAPGEETEWAGRLLRAAALVFPRDAVSRTACLAAAPGLGELPTVPDITIALPPVAAEKRDPRLAIVIPNAKMAARTSAETSAAYIPFMVDAARALVGLGMRVLVVNHEGHKDRRLCIEIAAAAGLEEPVEMRDPLAVRELVGSAACVLSSRFHGAVSALAQGVPCFCTSWSHKYGELLGDFGCQDAVLKPELIKAETERLVALVGDQAWLSSERERLRTRREAMLRIVEDMWGQVADRIGINAL